MGSVTAIFLLPFLSIFAIFVGFFETLLGIGTEKVVLPYDPQNGIVWEYKEGDEAFVDCIDTEIKNGQQVFTFRGKSMLDENRPSYNEHKQVVDDLYFEDQNGNINKYYAFIAFSNEPGMGASLIYGKMNIYEESECAVFQYTVKAETPTEDFYWHIYDYNVYMQGNRFIGEYKLENVPERTYQFAFSPNDIKDHTFDMSFHYRNSSGKPLEKIEVTFEMNGKEVKVIEETHYRYVLDENGNLVEVKIPTT